MADLGKAAGQGAAIGGALATGTTAVVGSTVGTAAATAAIAGATGIAAASVVPLFGTAVAAIAAAIAVISAAVAAALTDTFHPDAMAATAWLLMFQVAPGLIYDNVDMINTETPDAPAMAARLVRYLRLVAGIVPNPSGVLYNPRNSNYRAHNLPTDTAQTNPYIESGTPDPGEPLTDARVTARIRKQVIAAGHRPASPSIPSMLRTPLEAKAALGLLRNPKFKDSGIFGWEFFSNPQILEDLRVDVARLRALAGEQGPDPYLAQLFGGDVTPHAPDKAASKDPKLAGAAGSAETLTPGRVAVGGVIVAGAVAGLAYLTTRNTRNKHKRKSR